MKRAVFGLVILFVMSFFIRTCASGIEVQPAIISKSNEQDRVWVGTFQLVWNEFIDKYVHTPVRLKGGTPIYVFELNFKTFDTASLTDKCYYKYSGNITKNTVKNIKKAIEKKFNETSDILDKLELKPSSNNFIIYVMLKKDFEFIKEFDKLGRLPFGKDAEAEYFGIGDGTSKDLKEGVKVLYYNNPKDYAVMLYTKDNEEVYLYKNAANKDFRTLYSDMKYKAATYKGSKVFENQDKLRVPNIKLNVTKTYDELSDKRVLGTNITIDKAIETVIFNMDSKGVQLKSEAALTFVESIGPMAKKPSPRYFYFDDTFVIFLKERTGKLPYFALRVSDITKFQ